MLRNRAIASVAAVTGIFGATVVATISLLQATVTSEGENDTVTLAAPSASVPVSSEPRFVPAELPEIPVISNQQAPSGQIGRGYATKAVVNASDGQVTGVESINFKGVDALAVTVNRTDGSVITGYVDRASGDIYEWAVVKAAPAPVQKYEEEEYESEEYEEEYEEEEYEEEEYEEEDERDNDDD